MNICFVNSTRKWGGVKSWCLSTATAAETHGARSVIFGKDARFIERAATLGIEAHRLDFGIDYNPFLIRRFARFFKTRGIQCVIVNVGKDLKSAGLAARLLGIPVIHRIGSPGDVRLTLENKFLHGFVRPALICCSDYTRRGLLHNLPYLADYVSEAIHPGVAISAHPLTTRTPYTLVTTSRLNADKRHIDVIRACRLLADDALAFSLRIVGEGAMAEELRRTTSDLGLDAYIQFVGYTNDVAGELRQADIFILPSRREPLGIALEEAMAGGLIPVARDAGGVPEIWPDFLRGNLLPPESRAPEFAAVLKQLLQTPAETLTALKKHVRDHAAQTFSVQRQTKRVVDFIAARIRG